MPNNNNSAIGTSVPRAVIDTARNLHTAEQYAQAWNALAQAGDRYADNAAGVLGMRRDAADQFFETLVKHHWENTVGSDAFHSKFSEVAGKHLDNYLGHLERGNLPNTQDIIASYEDALSTSGLDKSAAFDGAWARMMPGDALDATWGIPFLGMEASRMTTSISTNTLSEREAAQLLGRDLLQTLFDVAEQGSAADLLSAFARRFGEGTADYFRDAFEALNQLAVNLISSLELVSRELLDNPDPFVQSITYIRYSDPLVLDLDGDGLSITPLKVTPPILFDTDADGVKTATAWVGSSDGLVVFDRNGNGTIDSGAELLGDEWVLRRGPDANKQAAHGFAALADFDNNGDGVVNALDIDFTGLRLWRDLNQDGNSQSDELQTLAASGVQSIKVASTLAMKSYGDAMLIQDGSYVRDDGTTGQAGAFVLSQNLRVRQGTPITLSEEAKALPDVKGTGFVRDLREAATESPELVAMTRAVIQAPTRAGFEQKLTELLLEWANDSAYENASKDALQSGYGLILSEPVDEQERGWMDMAVKASEAERETFRGGLSGADQAKFDGMRERMVGGLERLYAYEAFTGCTFLQWTSLFAHVQAYQPPVASGTPVPVSISLSDKFQQDRSGVFSEVPGYIRVTPPAPTDDLLWSELLADAKENMLPALRSQQHLDKIGITVSDSGLSLDFSALDAGVATAAAASAYEGTVLLLDLQRDFGAQLASQGWDGVGQLRTLAQQAGTNAQIQQAFTDHGERVFLPGQTRGTVENEAFLGAAANDAFDAGGGDDVLLGGLGADTLRGGHGNDLLRGEDGNDALEADDGHDVLEGGAGNDGLLGGGGNDTLLAGTGDDGLWGGDGDDVLDGGTGSDELAGGRFSPWSGFYEGWGADTYRLGPGDGRDRIVDQDTTAGVTDKIVFKSGVLPASLQFRRPFNTEDLVITVTGSSDQVTVLNYFVQDALGGWAIEEIRFEDDPATVWSIPDIKAKVLLATEGADSLRGYASDDTIEGLSGDDVLYGRGGNDLLLGGGGNDGLVGDGGNDTLLAGDGNDGMDGGEGDDVFDGGAGNDVMAGGRHSAWSGFYEGWGADTYRFGLGDGQDRIIDQDSSAGVVDKIVFKAGVLPADIQFSRVSNNNDLVLKIAGTADQLTVFNYFVGDANGGWAIEEIRFENDPATVWSIADVKALILTGGAGNDTITGYATHDTLTGQDGDDALFGRAGDDLLLGGSGNDGLVGEGGNDTLLAGDGNDGIDGGEGDDVLDGGAGNDVMAGGRHSAWSGFYEGWGADTYRFGLGDGQDLIIDQDTTAGVIDKIVFKAGVSPANIHLSRNSNNNDLILRVCGITDQLTVRNYFVGDGNGGWAIEEIRFEDDPATVWSIADVKALSLTGGASNDTITGYATNDTITGQDGDDVLFGRAGDDFLLGGSGNDGLVGDGGNDTLIAGDGNDGMDGGEGDDVFDGGAGNDVMAGGRHSAWSGFYEGWGADTYRFGLGDGQDRIIDQDTTVGVTDKVVFKTGVQPADIRFSRVSNNNDLILKIAGTTDQLSILNYFVGDGSGGWAIEEIRFEDDPATVWSIADVKSLILTGGSGNDTITGYATNDTLTGQDGDDVLFGRDGDDLLQGGSGNNRLLGDGGNDTLTAGDGNDDIDGGEGDDVFDGGAGNDILAGGRHSAWSGFYEGWGADTYRFGRGDGQDRIIDQDTTVGVTDKVVFKTGVQPADIRFSRVSNNNDLILKIAGTTDQVSILNYFVGDGSGGWAIEEIRFEDDLATVWSIADVKSLILTGGAGNDTITGYATNDTLTGQDGDDVLFGRDGDDLLQGGSGNNRLLGDGGNDTLTAGDGNDDIDGGEGDDVFDGGAGNDILAGGRHSAWSGFYEGWGADTYRFGIGDGQDRIIDQDTTVGVTDKIVFKSGVQPADVRVIRHANGNDLVLQIAGTADQLTVLNYFVGEGNGGWAIEEIRFADDTSAVWTVADVLQRLYSGNAPVAASPIPPQTTYKALAWSFKVSAATFSDADSANGDVLHYGASLANGAPLPGWLSFDAASKTFSGTPGGADVGALSLRVTATDNAGQAATTDFALDIAPGAGVTLTGSGTLRGTEYSDTLSASAPDATLLGGDGNDRLVSLVNGGLIWGTTYAGGRGNDHMVGSYAMDYYRFERGDGEDTIVDDNRFYPNPAEQTWMAAHLDHPNYQDELKFGAGITPQDISLSRTGEHMVFTVDDGGGSVTVKDWFSSVFTRLENLKFADGTVWSQADMGTVLAAGGSLGTNIAPTLAMPLANQNATRDAAWSLGVPAGTFYDLNPGDALSYSASLAGGAALPSWLSFDAVTRTLSGTPLQSDIGMLHLCITATDPTGLATAAAFDLQVRDGVGVNLTGNGTLTGTAYRDTLNASGEGTTLIGGEGDDTLVSLVIGGYVWGTTYVGGPGNDQLTGSYAKDIYKFQRGDGQDTIVDDIRFYPTESTHAWILANPDHPNYQDELHLGAGIASDQVWFRKIGADLEMSIVGTTDSVTIKDWYTGPANRIERFKTADGKTLLDEDLEELVEAMDDLELPALGETALPQTYATALSTVIAENWLL